MDCSALLQIALQQQNASAGAASDRLSWVRKYAQSKMQRSRKKSFVNLRKSCHVSFVNENAASRPDDILPDITGDYASTKGSGSGKWKHINPKQALRCAFGQPSQSLKQIGLMVKPPASVTYVRDLLCLVGSLLIAAQAACIETIVCASMSVSSFMVIQFLWDETKYRIKPENELAGRATDLSILANHGRIRWAPGVDRYENPYEEDIIVRPTAIEATSAAAMWAAFAIALPCHIWHIFCGIIAPIFMCAICLGSDHHPANIKLMAQIEHLHRDNLNVIIFKGMCKQHGTGLCLAPILKHLDLACPSYCVAKMFRRDKFYKDFRIGIKFSIKKNLKWIKRDDPWRPDATHQAHARDVLEMAYFRRDLRNSKNRDDAFLKELESSRRIKGEKLLDACVGDWTKRAIYFWDRHGRFGCVDDVVDYVFNLLIQMGFHVIQEPSPNKWLAMWYNGWGQRIKPVATARGPIRGAIMHYVPNNRPPTVPTRGWAHYGPTTGWAHYGATAYSLTPPRGH